MLPSHLSSHSSSLSVSASRGFSDPQGTANLISPISRSDDDENMSSGVESHLLRHILSLSVPFTVSISQRIKHYVDQVGQTSPKSTRLVGGSPISKGTRLTCDLFRKKNLWSTEIIWVES